MLNVQPAIPIGVGEVNLLNRTIVPLDWQPDVTRGTGGTFGLGDVQHWARSSATPSRSPATLTSPT